MRIFVLLIGALLTLPTSSAQPGDTDTLELRVSGGFLGPEFVVTVSESGKLVATRLDHKAPAPETSQLQLSVPDQREIFLLAIQSTDFEMGCDGEVPDGTNATIRVRFSGTSLDRSIYLCGGSGNWPYGPKTTSLLSAINRHLPASMQVF